MINESRESEQADAPEPEVELEAQCPSLTGRSTLTYQVGRFKNEPLTAMHLRIVKNSGRGMVFRGWAPVEKIDSLLAGKGEVTGKTFQALHPGKSVNNGSFTVAILLDLGVVQPKDENGRHHERVSGATAAKAILARVSGDHAPPKSKKPKEA